MAGSARWTGAVVGLLVALPLLGCARYGFEPRAGDRGTADAPRSDAAVRDTSGEPARDRASLPASEAFFLDKRAADGPVPMKDLPPKDLPPKDHAVADKPPLIIPAGFVKVSATTFKMGSPASEACRTPFETEHPVTLTRPYLIASRETTVAEFTSQMGYTPPSATACGPTCPVVEVSWHEAAAYCEKLSVKGGLASCYSCTGSGATVTCVDAAPYTGASIIKCPGYRLPTEAEWENAYRAGTTTAYYNGASDPSACVTCTVVDPKLTLIGWYCGNGGSLQPVGQKAPNAWGLHDMAGNVWEWCHDAFNGDLLSAPVVDPVTTGGPNRVERGGAFGIIAMYARAAARISDAATDRHPDTGFRCARTLP